MNQRKGRVKQLWDLSFAFDFKGGDDDSVVAVNVDDLMSDSGKDDLEVRFSKPLDASKKTAIKDALWGAIEAFREQVFEVHGRPLLISAEPRPQEQKVFLDSLVVVDESTTQDKPTSSATIVPTFSSVVLCDGSIEERIEFMASPQDLFACLSHPERIQIWSRGTLQLPDNASGGLIQPGTRFSLFDGNVQGVFREVNAPLALSMDWRVSQWPPGHHSSVSIRLEAQPDRTVLHLKQEAVPNGQVEETRNNWRRFYWDPIKMTFGYGSFL